MQAEIALADSHTHNHNAEGSLFIWVYFLHKLHQKAFTTLPEVFLISHFFAAFSNET